MIKISAVFNWDDIYINVLDGQFQSNMIID